MNRHLKRLLFFLKDKDKKPVFSIISDVFNLWVLKKEFPLHYFGRFLYRKDAPEPENFMTQNQYNKLVDYLVKINNENIESSKLLDNKLEFYNHCKKHKLPTPEIVSYSIKNNYYTQNNKKVINTLSEFSSFFTNLFKTHKKLCLKPIDLSLIHI